MLDETRWIRLRQFAPAALTSMDTSRQAARVVEELLQGLEPPSPATVPYRHPARPLSEWRIAPSAGAEGATAHLVRNGFRYSITLSRPARAAGRREGLWQLNMSVVSLAPLSRAGRLVKDAQMVLALLLSLAAGVWATLALGAIAFGALAFLAASVLLVLLILVVDGGGGARPRVRDFESRFCEGVLGAIRGLAEVAQADMEERPPS